MLLLEIVGFRLGIWKLPGSGSSKVSASGSGKITIEDTSGRSYQNKKRSVESKSKTTDLKRIGKVPKTEKQGTENYKRGDGQENEISKASKSNTELFWSYVKQKSKRIESIPNLTKEDVELAVSDQEKTELLSQYFSAVFTHEEPLNWKISLKTDCEMSDMYFGESELLKELESLNTSKSPGFDGIHPLVLN